MQIFSDKIQKPRNRKPRNGKPRKTREYCSSNLNLRRLYTKNAILAALVVGVTLQPLVVKELSTNTEDLIHVNS